MRWLVIGAKGWIGSMITTLLREQGEDVIESRVRTDNDQELWQELDTVKPDRVFASIGRTHGNGCNTIDYLEGKDKLRENLRDNLYSQVSLALACSKRGIHLSVMGTGCIYSYNEEFPLHGKRIGPYQAPNFFGSSYSVVKGFNDRLLQQFPVAHFKIRMPITGDGNPRDFIAKICKYQKVINIPNSVSVLPDLLPLMIDLAGKGHVGPVNCCSPEPISHNEVLQIYREEVDPSFTWENFTLEEQNQILASERSNNTQDTSFLQREYPQLRSSSEAIRAVLRSNRQKLNPTLMKLPEGK